jgi:hypothetical protein
MHITHFSVKKTPVIETCRSSLVFHGGDIVMSKTNGMSTSCQNQQDAFINKIPKLASFTSEETFFVNISSPKPGFIAEGSWNYGLSGGQFHVIHRTFIGKKENDKSYTSTNK